MGSNHEKIQKISKITIAISVIVALSGIFLALAAHQILPHGMNAISQLGPWGHIASYGMMWLGFITLIVNSGIVVCANLYRNLDNSNIRPQIRTNQTEVLGRVDQASTHVESLEQILSKWVDESPKKEKHDRELIATEITQCAQQEKEALSLTISQEDITSFPDVFHHLPQLKELHLRYFQIETLPQSFSTLKKLERLTIDCPSFKILPDSIDQLESLKFLEINSSELSLPNSIGRLKNLDSLVINSKLLGTSLDAIGELENLNTLSLTNIKASTLPESVGKLQNLKNLSLIQCGLSTLPKSFGNLKNLPILELPHNKFKTLPEAIGQLTNLKYLNLNYNQLTVFPNQLQNLSQLMAIGIQSNVIKTLPDWLFKMKNLNSINANYNPLNSDLVSIDKRVTDEQAIGHKIECLKKLSEDDSRYLD